ncbi:GlcG/HbpS family heme-binding protein [Arthrobacter woluwensis]|uniref:GlcG/HbpS family heme-binding protein n=1 Tax=Arthrobacter woluwensis TaxID=156980 RepID=UPI00358FC773
MAISKSNIKVLSAAAAALLLTGGVTAAANAGQASQPAAVPAAETAKRLPTAGIPAGEGTTVSQNRISATASAKAVQAALAKCVGDKLPFVSVTVVDRFGTVQAVLRGDNAAQHTLEASKQKAYTAAAFGAPTSELAGRISGNGKPSIADLPGTLFLAGGVPLKVNGVSVAGIGVGGAPDGALDEACATAGAEAILGR